MPDSSEILGITCFPRAPNGSSTITNAGDSNTADDFLFWCRSKINSQLIFTVFYKSIKGFPLLLNKFLCEMFMLCEIKARPLITITVKVKRNTVQNCVTSNAHLPFRSWALADWFVTVASRLRMSNVHNDKKWQIDIEISSTIPLFQIFVKWSSTCLSRTIHQSWNL